MAHQNCLNVVFLSLWLDKLFSSVLDPLLEPLAPVITSTSITLASSIANTSQQQHQQQLPTSSHHDHHQHHYHYHIITIITRRRNKQHCGNGTHQVCRNWKYWALGTQKQWWELKNHGLVWGKIHRKAPHFTGKSMVSRFSGFRLNQCETKGFWGHFQRNQGDFVGFIYSLHPHETSPLFLIYGLNPLTCHHFFCTSKTSKTIGFWVTSIFRQPDVT